MERDRWSLELSARHERKLARARACTAMARLHAEQQQQHLGTDLPSSPAFDSPFSASRLVLDTKPNSGSQAPGSALFRSAQQQRPLPAQAAAIPLLPEVQPPPCDAGPVASPAADSSLWTVSKKDVLRRRELRQAKADSGLTPPPPQNNSDLRDPELLFSSEPDPSEPWPRFGADSPIFQLNNSPARQQQPCPNARSLSRHLFGSLRTWGAARLNIFSGGGAVNNALGHGSTGSAPAPAAAAAAVGGLFSLVGGTPAQKQLQQPSTSPVPETPSDVAAGEPWRSPGVEPGERCGGQEGRRRVGCVQLAWLACL